MVIWAKPHLGKWQPWRHLCEICQGYFAVGIHTAWYLVRDHPDDARNHASLRILYGYIGRKEDAIRESRRAVELGPESTDAVNGVQRACDLALVYARNGRDRSGPHAH